MTGKRIKKPNITTLPSTKDVWKGASELLLTAYYYDTWRSTGKPPTDHEEIHDRAIKRIQCLLKVEREYPRQIPWQDAEATMATYEVYALERIYSKAVRLSLSRQEVKKRIFSEFSEEYPDNDLSLLVLTKSEIQARYKGSMGGAREAAITMAGLVFHGISRTKMKKLMKTRESAAEASASPSTPMDPDMAQRQNEKVREFIISNLKIDSPWMEIFRTMQLKIEQIEN